ncbi:uncharacterized protein LOC62_03G003547 [Vanrija pseudolonga]|uniref:Uncharacterized protein n=1 Tax=Vanrija pseudolonga TaxID=143232 RepID=A0AAF0Y8P0_9TREE|nr:hypothetical protein LOC62_03G003547 [Vanrija pseudolonga]
MPWWNNIRWSGHPAFSGSSQPYVTPNPEYNNIFLWLSGIEAGATNPEYMCQTCRYLRYPTCWDFYTISQITDSSYYAFTATVHRDFNELENHMVVFRQVREWQQRNM